MWVGHSWRQRGSSEFKINECFFLSTGQCCVMFCHLYEYHYINDNKNWTEAQQYCREKHTDLATVSDMEGLKRLFNNSPAMTEAWIGLYDQTNGNRRWYWSLPGVEFNENETEWNSGEPNDLNTENCGCILKSLKWIDISCGFFAFSPWLPQYALMFMRCFALTIYG
uniref:C-type lectin domain-containing protein n=1 Tax=Fundulus heteroclitus TaxID=8078 RepID=A0A3Q2R057_FUNHE